MSERTDAGGQATLATPKMKVRVDLAHGRGRVPRRAGSAGPRREEGRALPRAGRGPGGADVPRPPGVERERRRGALRPRPAAARPRWTSRATTSTCGSATPRSIVPFLVSSRGYGILWDNTSYTRFGDLRPWEPDPARPALRRDGEARRPHRLLLTRARASRRSWRRASTPRSPSPCRAARSSRTCASTRRSRRRGRRACAGRARSRRPRPATTSSSSTRTAASACGWTAGSWPTTGARAGCPGSTSPASRSRRGRARAQGRVVEGPGDGDGAAPVEDAGAGAIDVALVRGRRRRRLLLRLRAGPRPRASPATGG